MADAIKFIHAADLHLDQPISGLSELPTHLRSGLSNAPYVAAQKIFDLAIAERVDFVLLCGDLYDSESASARAFALQPLLKKLSIAATERSYVRFSPAATPPRGVPQPIWQPPIATHSISQ